MKILKEIQQKLIEKGYFITADGIDGPKTKEAIISFQKSVGLIPDGIVGPKTEKLLFAEVQQTFPVSSTLRDEKVSLPRVQKLHPKIRDEVLFLLLQAESHFPASVAIRIVQGLRTIQEQDGLYAQGRTKPGPIVTKAPGGKSNHNYGLAFDFALLYDKDRNGNYEELSWSTVEDLDRDGQADWMEVVNTFKKANYEWGGDWHSINDDPHIEKNFGYNVSQLLAKYKAGEVDKNKYVII